MNTPALVLDLDAFERNIARMAAFAQAHGVALRPHAKTHKSADVARAQIAAGAIGQCCAKLGEAEALAGEGIDGLHLTSPIVTDSGIGRLVALNARVSGLSVVADHPDAVDALAAAAAGGKPVNVVVDIDPGIRRTGVASAEHALALARRIGEHARSLSAPIAVGPIPSPMRLMTSSVTAAHIARSLIGARPWISANVGPR